MFWSFSSSGCPYYGGRWLAFATITSSKHIAVNCEKARIIVRGRSSDHPQLGMKGGVFSSRRHRPAVVSGESLYPPNSRPSEQLGLEGGKLAIQLHYSQSENVVFKHGSEHHSLHIMGCTVPCISIHQTNGSVGPASGPQLRWRRTQNPQLRPPIRFGGPAGAGMVLLPRQTAAALHSLIIVSSSSATLLREHGA